MPWKLRTRRTRFGRQVTVELFTSGHLQVVAEDERELSPSEVAWIEAEALPELWIEWCASKPLR